MKSVKGLDSGFGVQPIVAPTFTINFSDDGTEETVVLTPLASLTSEFSS